MISMDFYLLYPECKNSHQILLLFWLELGSFASAESSCCLFITTKKIKGILKRSRTNTLTSTYQFFFNLMRVHWNLA